MVFNGTQDGRPERTPAQRAAYRAYWKIKDDLLDRALIDPRLCPLSFRVLTYAIKAKHPDGKYKFLHTPDSQFFASSPTVAEEIGTGKKSASAVFKAFKKLEAAGYFICMSRGRRGYAKNSTTAYKLGDGLTRPEENVPGDNHSAAVNVPGDNQSPERMSQKTITDPRECLRRRPSILEARDSISEANSISDTQEGTRAGELADPDTDVVGDQTDQSSASAGASAPDSVGSFIGWDDRPSSDRPDRPSGEDPTDQTGSIDVMKMFGGLADAADWDRQRSRIRNITRAS
jgi:hypothetical protein